MSSPRTITQGNENIKTRLPETTVWKDFLALIKIGIVNSNLITTFTGIWLAIHFSNKEFFRTSRYIVFHFNWFCLDYGWFM